MTNDEICAASMVLLTDEAHSNARDMMETMRGETLCEIFMIPAALLEQALVTAFIAGAAGVQKIEKVAIQTKLAEGI